MDKTQFFFLTKKIPLVEQFNFLPKFVEGERKKEIVLDVERKGVEMTMYGKVFDFPEHHGKRGDYRFHFSTIPTSITLLFSHNVPFLKSLDND